MVSVHSRDFLKHIFVDVVSVAVFLIRGPKISENWSQHRPKIDKKSMSAALQKNVFKNVPHVFDFLCFFEKAEPQKCGPRARESAIFTNLG